MKEKDNKYEYNLESNKTKVFQVLNKKRKADNSLKDLNQTPKKNIFILYKPKNDLNTKQNILQKNINENLINNLNLINKNNIQKNVNISIIKDSPKNSPKQINDNKIEKNKIINNNININNNYNQIIKKNIKININIIKNDEITESTKNDNQNNIAYGDYICYKDNQIGSGSFGEVLYGIHKNKSLEVAVKIINSETSKETIDREINFTKKLQNIIGFPVIYYTGIHDNKNIIVESLLGPSLDKLFRYCDKIFPLKTVCLIGKEMVKRLESMHDKGLLHRDLKPNNLTWGNFNNSYNNILNSNLQDINNINNNKLDINTIFLIDFGLSCSYYEHGLTTRHYKIKNGFNFVGTLRYASLNSHKGIRQGRRDDLESMMYILIYFLKGKLPWQDIKAKQKEERHKLIFQIKSKTSVESLCKDLPNEFADLLNYVKSLQFDEKPSYCKFYAYFHNLISKMNIEQIPEKNFNYIWEKMLVDNMNKYEENKDEGIIQEAEKIIFKGYPINLRNFTNYLIYNNKCKK